MPTVHLLMVHGVGGHDHLGNLLRTYQSFRANLTSVEAPVLGEDRIPGWRLTQFEEGASPPFLKLEPRVQPPPGGPNEVRVYEVNYSGLAGVVRRNHPIDLTTLFLGLDLAVCAARQRMRAASSVLGGNNSELGRCLQRVSGVFVAGTVPIIGLPSIVLRRYIDNVVSTFTRFFEDVATFALDKNGEQLISAHLDRTMASIAASMKAGDRLVVAAHSLGSVVVHNFVVRHWCVAPHRVPDILLTFGSPIGLVVWTWLFLDFQNMNFHTPIAADRYFCWNPVRHGTSARKQVSWINVVNLLDPIATSFPDAAVDLSASATQLQVAMHGGTVAHRFFGPAKATWVGAAHTEYLNDKEGFLRILLRAAGLAPGDPYGVPSARSPQEHQAATRSVLQKVRWGLWAAALVAMAGYFWVVVQPFGDRRAWCFLAMFASPPVTMGLMASFQRLLLGGPTKRIAPALVRGMAWRDAVSFPYRLRETVLRKFGRSRNVNPMAASSGRWARHVRSVISFVPALVVMFIPIADAASLTGFSPSDVGLWARLLSPYGLLAFVCFMAYVMCCAGHELVRAWRDLA